jgi:hypothetical protein
VGKVIASAAIMSGVLVLGEQKQNQFIKNMYFIFK